MSAPATAAPPSEAAQDAEARAAERAADFIARHGPLTDDQCARAAALLASVRGGEGR